MKKQEKHAASHIDDLCMKEDQTTILDAPLESFHEVNDIETHGRQIDSTRDASF